MKLSALCQKIGSGATPKGGSTVYVSQGVSLIRSQNVYNNQFEYGGLCHITDEAARKLDSVTVQEGDVLLNITGDSVARCAIVPGEVLPARVNQHVAIIRPKKDLLDNRFLMYYLTSPRMQALMLGVAVGKGASRNALTKGMIENFDFPCLSIVEQRKIVNILAPYDSLIENNRRQIKLLEEAAQRLYKEWFVDLRFPGHEHTPIVNGIPQGWMECKIKDICLNIYSGGTPSRKKTAYWQGGQIPWYKTKELTDSWLIRSEERITEEALNASSAKIHQRGTLLMAIYASPTLGRLGILDSDAACNQAALGLLANPDLCSELWLFLKLMELRSDFNALARGAGQQNISADVVKNTCIIFPEREVMKNFSELVNPLFERILSAKKMILSLTEARDRLLPKLMSGEV